LVAELTGVATDVVCDKVKPGARGVAAGAVSEMHFLVMFLDHIHGKYRER